MQDMSSRFGLKFELILRLLFFSLNVLTTIKDNKKTAYRKNTVARWIFEIILTMWSYNNVQGIEILEIANFVILANLSTVYDTANII